MPKRRGAGAGPGVAKQSGHRRVSWDKKGGQWRAQIGIDGTRKRLGTFDDEVTLLA